MNWRVRSIGLLLVSLVFFALSIYEAHRHPSSTAAWIALGVVFLVLGARKTSPR